MFFPTMVDSDHPAYPWEDVLTFRERVSALIANLLVMLAMSGCDQYRTTWTYVETTESGSIEASSSSNGTDGPEHVEFKYEGALIDSLPFRIALIHPVDAVFIGVSNFSPESGKVPTPAHAIGVHYLAKIFQRALDHAPDVLKSFIADSEIIPRDRSSLASYTNLRLDPIDATWRANEVQLILDLLEAPVNKYDFGQSFSADKGWPYLNESKPLTKSRILEIAQVQARRLAESEGKNAPIAIFYLATHGRIGPDGQRYAMAADSTRDLATWIRYEEIADLFHGTRDGKPSISAIVLFDTCLEGEGKSPSAKRPSPPDGTVMLSAAAPGEYSWHWSDSMNIGVIKAESKAGVFKNSGSQFDASFYTSMSVLPVALATSIQRKEVNCATNPTKRLEPITSIDLIQFMLKWIPFLTDAKQSHRHQTAEVFASEATRRNANVDDFKNLTVFVLPCYPLFQAEREYWHERRRLASGSILDALRNSAERK